MTPPVSQLGELGTSDIPFQVQEGLSSPGIAHAVTANEEREDRWAFDQVTAVEVETCGRILGILKGRTNRIHCHFILPIREERKAKRCHCHSLPRACIPVNMVANQRHSYGQDDVFTKELRKQWVGEARQGGKK